ncbi:MAG: hypothetical protein FWG98_13945 [Candidatus Cloacimonetes bacterium]|nr:hypothetical protein [Candidatus Cloacimonadota bacterium]
MEKIGNTVSLNELFVKIRALPIEHVSRVQELVSHLSLETPKRIRACSRPDSIMNTRPLLPTTFKCSRDDLYD